MKARILTIAVGALCLSGFAAMAQTPERLEQNKDWATYAFTGNEGKTCYALSMPLESLPTDRNHGDVFFFVTSIPAQQVRNEPSFRVGYNFKPGSMVEVDVDGKKFSLFTKDQGAWVKNPADEKSLVAAMKAGSKMTVNGVSGRGTQTTYKFSLSGITASVRAAEGACK
ncbi:invasion associated locus B family protein [Polycladidibacter hongkongensis]|uniref:invasion associated locus B family protein n=1 Tax=Polycladidibacter hongkongensis TaxID=1647556 RepID=UPI00083731F5|nr:invasion associated locus B family protein [Pseudovibrio hongkongensis]